ncbi:MAG: CAAX protease family protein, partial [Lactobacillus iners]|nr:CAAX protease family protein [Lactobacillus iners]
MKTVNTPKSFQGNIVRYSVYLVIYLFLYACIYQVIHIARVNWLIDIPILIFVLLGLFFYTRRYNKEQRYFEKKTEITLASDYKLIVGATILLIAFRLLIAYFQFKKYVPFTGNQLFYLQHENNDLFWLLIIYQGLFLSIMQQFLGIGFFFNYFFRKQTFFHAMV